MAQGKQGTSEGPQMIQHAANTSRTANVTNIRKTETKTIRTACGRRIARDLTVSAEETNCTSCARQLQADAQQFADRAAHAAKYGY
jgi:hypothetical protein